MELHIRVEKCGIVNNVSFKARGLTLLVGPNGAGKTTILRALAGVYRCRCNVVDPKGRDLCELDASERSIGYVPQGLALFKHMSVFENIAYGLVARGYPPVLVKRKVHDVARLVGVEHLLQRRVWALSGGEARKVALARALAIEPKVLLLDEAFDGIDAGTRRRLIRIIADYVDRHDAVAILVTHHIDDVVRVARIDRVVVVNNGSVVYEGEPSPRAIPGELRTLLGYFTMPDCRRIEGGYYVAEVEGVKILLEKCGLLYVSPSLSIVPLPG